MKRSKNEKRIGMSIMGAILILTTMLISSGPIFADDGSPDQTTSETALPTITPTATATETPTEEPMKDLPSDPPDNPEESPTTEPVEPTEIPPIESSPIEEATPTEEVTPTIEASPTPTDEPEVVPLIEANSTHTVSGQYIVVFKEQKGVDAKVNAVVDMVGKSGGEIQFIYSAAINGFSAKLDEETLHQLRRNEDIDYIEQDQVISIDDEDGYGPDSVNQSGATWGLDRIDQRALPLDGIYHYPTNAGAGVHAYVIDTGIRSTHTQYAGRVSLNFDAFSDGYNGSDCHGHGTHVAGTIGGSTYGVAKQVQLHSVRVLDCNGNGTDSSVIAGIDWVAKHFSSPAVANMSLGGGASSALDAAVNSAIKKGITFVVAAGNSNKNASNYSPARVSNAITVAASDSSDTRGSFSNYGSVVDIFAPGVNITSSTNDSNSSTAAWNGTSMAAPHVTGAVALYLAENPNASPATVASMIISQATTGVIQNASGSPNRLLSIISAKLAKVTLVSPANNTLTNDTTPSLQWKADYIGNSYQVQIDDSSNFDSLAYSTTTEALTATSSALSDGKYYWRVRSKNLYNEYGAWSSAYYFTVDTIGPAAPVLVTPKAGSQIVGTPTFSWKASPTAVLYQFQYNTSASTSSYIYQSPAQPKTSIKPPTMTPMVTYYWFVRAQDKAGNWGAWSSPQTIMVVPPVPASPKQSAPANNAFTNDTTPSFSWSAVDYGANYHIQISDNPKFTTILQEREGISGLTFTATALSDGKYYWRVRARNVNNEYGKWSSSLYFTVDTIAPAAPVLVKPTSGFENVGTPTFSWKASPTAKLYQFQYNTSSSSSSYVYQSGAQTKTSIKPPAMTAMVTYYWFARAQDAAGNWSAWSSPNTIKIIPPTPVAVKLKSPATNYITDSTSFSVAWNAVDYGNIYQIQIDDSSKFDSVNYTYNATAGATSYTIGSLATGKWYWRVRAQNVNNVYGPWSSAWYFTIYPKFNTQFNTTGNFENWAGHPGATWSVGSGNLYNNGISNGYTSSASYSSATFSDFTYSASVKMNAPASGYANVNGVVIRGTPTFDSSNDWQNGYYFGILQVVSGGTQLACYNVYKISNGKWSSLTLYGYWWCYDNIKYADYNTFKVYAKGSTLKFYVNNTLMLSKTSSGSTSGRLGVFSWGGSTAKTTYVDWATAGAPILPSSASEGELQASSTVKYLDFELDKIVKPE